MGKSLRTPLVSYTSLYLRRSRTGRGFKLPTDRASPRGLPRRIQSRPTVFPIPARAKSKSRPVASGMLSETTRHHPTSMPRSDPVVRRSTSHTTTRTAASGFLNGRFSSNHHPFLLYLMARGGCKRFVEPPPKAAGITLGPDRSLIRPFFMPLSTEVSRRLLRAPVGPQLHYLTVHLL
jgi:hypothetical protein